MDDAQAAVSFGADYLGLIFVPNSPRCVTFEAASAIIKEFDDRVTIVGVFKDTNPTDVDITVSALGLSAVQYHGAESPETCTFTTQATIKAFELSESLTAEFINTYTNSVDYILLDRSKKDPDKDIKSLITIASNLVSRHREFPPCFYAGGLTPENVKEVITTVRPYAVDVASGVESSPGKKDIQKLKQFCQAVKETSLCNH